MTDNALMIADLRKRLDKAEKNIKELHEVILLMAFAAPGHVVRDRATCIHLEDLDEN